MRENSIRTEERASAYGKEAGSPYWFEKESVIVMERRNS
jgi:hypothetical protein